MKLVHRITLTQLRDKMRESLTGPELRVYKLGGRYVTSTNNVFAGMTPSDVRHAVDALDAVLAESSCVGKWVTPLFRGLE